MSEHGWGPVYNVSRKWHYFHKDGRSLCGRFMTFAKAFELGNDASPDNCEICRRRNLRLAQLNSPPDGISSSKQGEDR